MLNQHERRQLELIEQWFETSDPGLTSKLRQLDGKPRIPRPPVWLIALDAFGVALVVLGAVVSSDELVLDGLLAIIIGAALHVRAAARHQR